MVYSTVLYLLVEYVYQWWALNTSSRLSISSLVLASIYSMWWTQTPTIMGFSWSWLMSRNFSRYVILLLYIYKIQFCSLMSRLFGGHAVGSALPIIVFLNQSLRFRQWSCCSAVKQSVVLLMKSNPSSDST